jgi:ribosomal-protein-alanine N-acetyltransferase
MSTAVREARCEDLVTIAAIERASFSDPWSRGMFQEYLALDGGSGFLVADDAGVVTGYAITRTVADEAELLNIAVEPSLRKCGIGALLLDAAMERCQSAGALEMWLEVRESNAGARALYDLRGFVAVGTRKRYYQAPREDAIVLRAPLGRVARTETVTRAVGGLTAVPADSILSSASHLPRQETICAEASIKRC